MSRSWIGPDGLPDRFSAMTVCGFIAGVYYNRRGDMQALLNALGGGAVKKMVFNTDEYPPSWAVIQQAGVVLVVFSGTQNWRQLVKNLQGSLMRKKTGTDDEVNAFAYATYQGLHDDVMAAIGDPANVQEIKIAGHSYGAQVAQLFALEWVGILGAAKVSVMGICSPKLFIAPFNGTVPSTSLMFAREHDPVPCWPKGGSDRVSLAIPIGRFLSLSSPWKHVIPTYLLHEDGVFEPMQDFYWNFFILTTPTPLGIERHGIGGMLTLLSQAWQNFDGGNYGKLAYSICAAGGALIQANKFWSADPPETYINFGDANSYLFQNNPSFVLTRDNVGNNLYVGGEVTSVRSGTTGSILDFSGVTSMAFGTKIRVLMDINNNKYGRGEEHTLKTTGGISDAKTQAFTLCSARSWLLGNSNGGALPDNVVNLASPAITELKLRDALAPRNAISISLDGNVNMFGPGSNPADNFCSSLVVRLTAINEDTPSKQVQTSLMIVGQPDDAIRGGRYNGPLVIGGGFTFNQKLLAYLNLLTNSSAQWGCMMQSQADPKKDVESFTLTAGAWVLNVPAHGYDTGDKIRLTATDVKAFEGTYTITAIDSNNFKLAAGPTSSLVPTKAKVQRYQLADGTRVQSFGRYQTPEGGWAGALFPKVSKKDPARPIAQATFRKRRTRSA
jgi:hypothetical protein